MKPAFSISSNASHKISVVQLLGSICTTEKSHRFEYNDDELCSVSITQTLLISPQANPLATNNAEYVLPEPDAQDNNNLILVFWREAF